MNPKIALKQRINLLFGVLCLPVGFLLLIPYLLQGIDFLGISMSPYVRDFVLRQFLYALLNLLLSLFVLRFLSSPRKIMRFSRPKKDLFLWIGLFLGTSALGNIGVSFIPLWLERLGITLPPVFSQYTPQTWGQAVIFFVVTVLIPAFYEEVMFRAMGAGGLREFHPGAAVFLSALGFAMLHINVQQIPFAFLLGLVLGFVYVKTGNFSYPVLLHFLNNAWAYGITVWNSFGSAEEAAAIQLGCLILFLLCGIVSFFLLLRKKAFSLAELPAQLSGKEAMGEAFSSVGLWGFLLLYGMLTVASLKG